MKDTLSRILAILAILVGIGTMVVAYMLWTMIVGNKAVFTDMLNGYEHRLTALETWRAEQVRGEEEPEDTRALMPEGYTGTLEAITPPADELVEYRNAAIGLVMKVPYNSEWGNRLYRVAPYQEGQYADADGVMRTVVQFGMSFIFEGGGWARQYTLAVSDPRSVADEKAHIQQVHEGFLNPDRPIEELNVNGKSVLVSYADGLCSYVQVTVIGQKANYTFTPTCGDSDEIREEFLNIVRTMEFID